MASTYLTKTFGTPTDTKIYTFSCWVKRSKLGVQQSIARSTNGNDDSHVFTFNSDDTLRWDEYGNSSTIGTLKTNRLFRDTNAWYHVVLAWDTTNATAGDRMKMWINGVEETSFATDTNPSLNATSAFNKASQPINIGRTSYGGGGNYFDGSMAHYHFIDGTAYDADTFGETDATTGIWKPKTAPSVTYGTNGFFLKFASSGSLGTDSSGNGNNFTLNGSGTQTQDTPSNVFATWNPLDRTKNSVAITLSNGNTSSTIASGQGGSAVSSTLGISSGKYYYEAKVTGIPGGNTDYPSIGWITENVISASIYAIFQTTTGVVAYNASGQVYKNNSLITTFSSFTTNDIIGVAYDSDSGKIWFAKNGTWQGSGDPSAGSNEATTLTGLQFPAVSLFDSAGVDINFGNGYFGTTAVSSAQSPSDGIGLFEYSVPSGYKALCTKSINAQEYS